MDYGTSELSTEFGTIPVLTMANIQNGEISIPLEGGVSEISDSMLLERHDLLFTRTNGNPDLVGKVGIFRGQKSPKVTFASYLVRLRVKTPFDPQWLHMLLNSQAFWPYARSHALVNLQTNLNATRYGHFVIPVPPPKEQPKIVSWVNSESVAVNEMLVRIVKELQLIQEYRTRLISDVVTGKVDVRAAAASLPGEPDEPSEMLAADPDVDSDEILEGEEL